MNSSRKYSAMIVKTILLTCSIGFGLSFTLRRVTRYSLSEARFINSSIGEIIEFNICQDRGQHYVTCRSNIFIPTSPDSVRFDFLKCNDNYVDCVHSNSWTLENFCDTTQFYISLMHGDKSLKNPLLCPLKGEISIKNMTINEDLFKTLLSTSLTDRWWEYYWILRTMVQSKERYPIFNSEVQFYFLSYRQKARSF